MKRKLTQIELLQRENLRLRQELASSRAAGGGAGAGAGAGGSSPVKGGALDLSPGGAAAVEAAAAASPGGAAAELGGFGSVSEELLEQNAALQEAVASAEQEVRAARKLEASREGSSSTIQP